MIPARSTTGLSGFSAMLTACENCAVRSDKNKIERRYIRLSVKNRPYRKLHEGIVIEVSPTKIPRIIGKQGSMIKMLKENSGCDILVGQNGWVWIKNDDPTKQMLMVNAIKKIESDSHTTGLTDKIKKMLNSKGGK